MTDPVKLARFIIRLRRFSVALSDRKDLLIHSHINQFYYMQKITELNELCHQLQEAAKRVALLNDQLDQQYTAAFSQWRHDLRWFHAHLRNNDREQPRGNITTAGQQP